MQILKQKLLDTGYFIDNCYLADYLNLVKGNSVSSYLERHHILPRAYYKMTGIEIDNSEANLVALSFADHCKAHWLLYYCTTKNLQHASQAAFILMINGLSKHIKDYTEADFIALQEMKNKLLEDSNAFWSVEDDNFLKHNFLDFTDDELAFKLGRTEIAVRARRTYLHLQRFKMMDFTEEEINFIVANFNDMFIEDIAIELNRSPNSVRQKCFRLGLRKKAESWSIEELAFLRENASTMSLTDLSTYLDRSKSAIKRQCHIHKIKCKRTDLWTEEELQYLKDNYSTMTNKQLADTLDRSVSAVNHKCQVLKLKIN